jgi:hypothetical protein
VTNHKFIEDVHEDSLRIPIQKNRFLCIRPDKPLKASGRPAMSRSFIIEDARTLEQHRQDARSSFSNFYAELDFSSRHCLGSVRRLDDVAARPDVVQLFRISGLPFEHGKEL